MDNTEHLLIERYRLTLTHDIIQGDKTVRIEEPKVFEIHNRDCNNEIVAGYKDYLIDQLFTRFRRELNDNK